MKLSLYVQELLNLKRLAGKLLLIVYIIFMATVDCFV